MTAYYNENDPQAAEWLRELIKAGLIAPGDVDDRSILEVEPGDLGGYAQCHFFAGIGGWSYALRLAGLPDDAPVWTGSPPCQPFSAAGQQRGRDDARHLAPHFLRLVRACRPPVLFGEQVASAAVLGRVAGAAKRGPAMPPEWAWFDDLRAGLEAAHYAVGCGDIPAAGIGAPHIRQRCFFGAVRLAHSDGAGRRQAGCDIASDLEANGSGAGDRDSHGGADIRLADAERRAAERHGQQVAGTARGMQGAPWEQRLRTDAGDGKQSGGVADADGRHPGAEGLQRSGEYGRGAEDGSPGPLDHGGRPGADHGFWSDADWIFCTDGKWRPVEPGLEPLAHGLSGRVGLLRGYGNAIVPQAAAEFVQAFREVTH